MIYFFHRTDKEGRKGGGTEGRASSTIKRGGRSQLPERVGIKIENRGLSA